MDAAVWGWDLKNNSELGTCGEAFMSRVFL